MTIETIKHYLTFVTSIKEMAEGVRWFYNVGDDFTIEVVKCTHDLNDKNDLMNLWKKHGFINKVMPTHVGIHVYSTNCNNCHKYNIIEKRSEDDKRYIVNFDYLREFTPDNVNELVAECIKLINKD